MDKFGLLLANVLSLLGDFKMILNELLSVRNFNNRKVKLIRHQDSKYDTKLLYELNQLEFYQSIQSGNPFKDADYILSFLGYEQTKAIFIGAYKVVSMTEFDREIHAISGYIYEEIIDQPLNYYKLEKVDSIFDDLIDRIVIEWGTATRSWFQWLSDDNPKEVIEILPKGYVRDFPGYENVILKYNELLTITTNIDANRIWYTMLSSVAGIYLITDLIDGSQYVGSAYGNKGIFGRWSEYAKTLHGNNKLLIEHLIKNPNRHLSFQYSILQTLPRSMNKDQVVQLENSYKRKLGTRAFGLNNN